LNYSLPKYKAIFIIHQNQKTVSVLFSHNFSPLFLGKFGPLGETYDESEALGEPLALDLRTAEE